MRERSVVVAEIGRCDAHDQKHGVWVRCVRTGEVVVHDSGKRLCLCDEHADREEVILAPEVS